MGYINKLLFTLLRSNISEIKCEKGVVGCLNCLFLAIIIKKGDTLLLFDQSKYFLPTNKTTKMMKLGFH